MKGYRKILVFTEALVAFVVLVIVQGLTDAGAIMSTGLAITGILGAAIYGNVKEHQANGTHPSG